MTNEILEQKLRNIARKWWFKTKSISLDNLVTELLMTIVRPREERIAKLIEENEQLKKRIKVAKRAARTTRRGGEK